MAHKFVLFDFVVECASLHDHKPVDDMLGAMENNGNLSKNMVFGIGGAAGPYDILAMN